MEDLELEMRSYILMDHQKHVMTALKVRLQIRQIKLNMLSREFD